MKILVICQYYYPEPFRIQDICEEMVKRGHEVTVVTGLPNYPMGEIYDGYRHGEKRDEIINGVNVHRCFTFGRKTGVIRRFLNYYSYSISSYLYISHIREKFDVVFVNQLSPIMMANAGVKYKRRRNKKMILYCLDLWPESLAVGGIKRASPLYKHYHKVSKKIYNCADTIFISSKLFQNYLSKEFDISPEKIIYLPQFAEEIFIKNDLIKEGDKKQITNFVFAGNIGSAQSVETIIESANILRQRTDIHFHILGDGSSLKGCKSLVEKFALTNVTFYGRKPLKDMVYYYKMADAMLITMVKNPTLSLTLPGKVQSYLAAGKPIIGAIDGEGADLIHRAQCGYCSSAEDSKELALCLLKFTDGNQKKEFSFNAKNYYKHYFSKERFINEFEKILYE
ncbi:glycosyltransferase family 4 protein [Scatolibacter rhodanostii]|uniref:glycosyltransferase family 4 protein n=1 Tax=Scatolibacter rhodanostii TaxID=2014781 RepID=UPI000C079E44|nr:glycosyltransferase family 4 protein [Scatolibacter rhodanostii]